MNANERRLDRVPSDHLNLKIEASAPTKFHIANNDSRIGQNRRAKHFVLAKNSTSDFVVRHHKRPGGDCAEGERYNCTIERLLRRMHWTLCEIRRSIDFMQIDDGDVETRFARHDGKRHNRVIWTLGKFKFYLGFWIVEQSRNDSGHRRLRRGR